MNIKRAVLLFAILTLVASGCKESGSGQASEDSRLVLNTGFADPSSPVGKTSWKADDKVAFMIVKGSNAFREQMRPKSVSADGTGASFEFSAFFPKDADAYCAYIMGSGADAFAGNCGVHVPAVSTDSSADFPVTIGFSRSAATGLSFVNVYSHLCFTIKESGISHVILEGNGKEGISRANIISLEDMSVTADPDAPSSETSIRKEVYGPGTYYIPLYPGIVLESGYTLTAYATSGRAVMTARSDERLEVGSGKLYACPELSGSGESTGLFDAANVECSFGVMSDTHIDAGNGGNCQNKFAAALAQLKGQALKDDPDGIDGILIAGDLTNNGASNRSYYSTEIQQFRNIYEAALDPMKIPMVYALGNHDPFGWWGQNSSTNVYSESRTFRQTFGDDKYGWTDIETSMRDAYECRHCVIGKYHVLCVTPNSVYPVSYPAAITDWLDRTLAAVTSADPERYVILLTHPMIYNTVYGSLLGPGWMMCSCSDYWYTKSLTDVLVKYPQVMTFSGHLHFPINDPRSIWQGDFTAFGCGSTRYMAIEDGRYEDMSSATVMKDANDISSGLLLQFDKAGNARITKMFFSQNVTFDYPWEIKHPCKDRSHLQTYSHQLRRAANTEPEMEAPEISLSSGAMTRTVTAIFKAGKDDEFVHHYVVSLRRGSEILVTKRILADFYKHQWFSDMAGSYTVQMGSFGSGEYTLTVDAYDSWDAKGNASTSFRIE